MIERLPRRLLEGALSDDEVAVDALLLLAAVHASFGLEKRYVIQCYGSKIHAIAAKIQQAKKQHKICVYASDDLVVDRAPSQLLEGITATL